MTKEDEKGITIWGRPEDVPLEEPIKDAFKNDKLAFFLGAGVSNLIGCPDWTQLTNKLIECCYKENLIDFKLKEDLLKLRDNKKKISICKHILENKKNGLFFSKFKEYLKISKEKEKENKDDDKDIYEYLKNISAIFITTNHDDYLSRHFDENKDVAYELDHFDADNIGSYKLYHLHGHIRSNGSIITTVDDYLERYSKPKFKTFIKKLLKSEYTLIFIGYGLNEFELLDYLALTDEENKKSRNPHYILLPFFSHQKKLAEFEQVYFKNFNINIIAYSKDKKGYDFLIEIIREWKNKLTETVRIIENQEDIDEAIPANGD